MSPATEKIVQSYAEAYQKLYKRQPRELRMLDQDWVIVNGARMRVRELEYLTHQMQLEYRQALEQRRGVVQRLMHWLKGT